MTKIAIGEYLQSLANSNSGGNLGLDSSKCYTYQEIINLDRFSISEVLDNNMLVKESLITYNSTQNVEITVTGLCKFDNNGSTFTFTLSSSNPVDVDLTVTILFSYMYERNGLGAFGNGSATANILAGGTSGLGSITSTRTNITSFNLSSATINPTSTDSQTYSAVLGSTEIVDNTTSTATTITWQCEDTTASGFMRFVWFDNTQTLTPEMIYNQLSQNNNFLTWQKSSAVIGNTQTVTSIIANSPTFDGSTTSIDVSGSSSTTRQILKIVTYKSSPSSVDDVSVQTVYITPNTNNVITLPVLACSDIK